MRPFNMPSVDAWREVYSNLRGDFPINAAFSMITARGACMAILVDGYPMDMYFTIRDDGTWSATYCPGGVPEHISNPKGLEE